MRPGAGTGAPRRRERAGHRVLPHPADVGLAFWAPTREGAFAEAALGLSTLLGARPHRPGGPGRQRHWRVEGADDVERLFKLLAQIVWTADVESAVPTRYEVQAQPRGALEVHTSCEDAVGSAGYDVKAVTYHAMAFGRSNGGWHGRAYFDL